MTLSPDEVVYFHLGPLPISATLVFTWLVMALLVGLSAAVFARLRPEGRPGKWQNVLEGVIIFMLNEIHEVTQQDAKRYLPFVGTLFLFIVTSNVLGVIPGFHSPTGSLTTTAALAIAVLLAVPVFGIAKMGLKEYLLGYLRPSPIMLPFTIIGELSRTLALAVRLFGNIMSGTVVVAILLSVAPLFFPVIMQAFGLLIGVIQAYIFSVLAIVYIGSATTEQERTVEKHALVKESEGVKQ